MARSIQEIKKTMTDAFMADSRLKEMYQIQEGKTFEGVFSAVSLESILFYIVAACHHVMESLFDRHRADVEEKISRAVVASVPWYYDAARRFQHGDSLVYDEKTGGYHYATVNEAARVVQYAAVRDRGSSIDILVSADKDGTPTPLSNDVLTAFKEYMNRIKIAGVALHVRSLPADFIQVQVSVQVDPLVIDATGREIAGVTKPVEDAVKAYLRGITYGGTFNKTKLVDAIQAVPGVVDVMLGVCSYKPASGVEFKEIRGNNYTAIGGSFSPVGLPNSIVYVV